MKFPQRIADAQSRIPLLVCLMILAGCGAPPHKATATKPLQVTAKRIQEPQQWPQYPSPADGEDDEEDDPAVDPTAARKLSGDWIWLGNLTPTTTFKVDQPDRYRFLVMFDGRFVIHADCVTGEGLFEARGNRIALTVAQQSGSGCEASHKDLYISSLESARNFRFVGDKLRLSNSREKLEMVFYRPR